MTHNIEIDDEVYSQLQKLARPFEDSPNSVLRRELGLDEVVTAPLTTSKETSINPHLQTTRIGYGRSISNRRTRMYSGVQLNDEWGAGARQSLFHRDGCWYNNLKRFPGALFDPNGYLLFETEEEFLNCQFLNIGARTNVNVEGGISAIPGYRKMK